MKSRSMAAPRCRIGISGWTFPGWRGRFYPEDLPHSKELAYASRQVNSIEINGTFYALQKPASYRKWYRETPDGFIFAVKGGRFITHIKRLKEVERPLANFFASGILGLREKLGPVLWQLPPTLRYAPPVLEAFLKQLPRDGPEASRLARRHDEKLSGETLLEADQVGPVRHALEIRHPSFATPDFIGLLRKYQVALVIADSAGKWPFFCDITADFIYVRLHGGEKLYAGRYPAATLEEWAARINRWGQGGNPRGVPRLTPVLPPRKADQSVFVYFDNDDKACAPFDAIALRQRLEGAAAGSGPGPCPDADVIPGR